MSNTDPHVLIVGAGITGLLCAQGLKKNNIKATVWEAASSLDRTDDDDWGMGIHWALPLLSDCLPDDLLSNVKASQVDPFYEHPAGDPMPIFNGETAEVIKTLPLPKMHRVARKKFRNLCASDINIDFDKSLVGIEHIPSSDLLKVSAEGRSPSSLEVTHVLGTDGARSRTRSLLLPGAKATSADYTAVRTLVQYSDPSFAQKLRDETHPINAMAIHPKGVWGWISMLSVPSPEDPAHWTFQLMASWPYKSRNDGERETVSIEQLKQRMDVFGDPLRSAFRAMPPDTRVRSNQTSYWAPPQEGWSAAAEKQDGNFGGRVQLAGDAAHPMTFHRGQGLNHAVADAAGFVRAMVKVGDAEGDQGKIKAAIEDYETEVVKRGGEEVLISFKNTVMLHDWDMVMESPLMKGGIARSK